MGVCDAGADREPETGAALLRGEEGVEHPVKRVFRNPGPVVGDGNGHATILGENGGDDPSATRGRIVRVHQKIEEELFELPGVADDGRLGLAKGRLDSYVLVLERGLHEFESIDERLAN